MNLKILLPYRVFAEEKSVNRIVAETQTGFFGILPNRLDFTAALVPGILVYENEKGKEENVAIDEGIMIKAGDNVFVSVRNAIGGVDLGKLRELVEKEFLNLDERERNVRSVMARLESGFIRELQKFYHD